MTDSRPLPNWTLADIDVAILTRKGKRDAALDRGDMAAAAAHKGWLDRLLDARHGRTETRGRDAVAQHLPVRAGTAVPAVPQSNADNVNRLPKPLRRLPKPIPQFLVRLIPDPLHPPDRDPLAWCFVVILAWSIFRTAWGIEPLPGSLEATPWEFGLIAAQVMFWGCLVLAVAILWPNRDNGLAGEFAGLVLTGFGLMLYGAALYFRGAPGSAIAFGLCAGIAVGAFAKVLMIVLYVYARKALAEEAHAKGTG